MNTNRCHFVSWLLALAGLIAASTPASAVDYQWSTSATTSDWQTAANWSGGVVPDFNTSGANRLNVNGPQKLVYSAAEGTTVYANNVTGGRGLVIGSGGLGSGEMEITGGSFSTLGSAAGDIIGNVTPNIGILTINGGTFISTNAGLNLGIGGAVTSTMNVQAGTATVATLTLNAEPASVNLSGTGVLEANQITRSFGTGTITFDGGTLRARTGSATFLQGLNSATVNAGGLTVDTNGQAITIGQALLAGTGSGGLTKTGANNLTLTGASTFTGPVVVNNGQLLLNTTGGGALASEAVTLTSTATARAYLQLLQSDQLPSTATLDMQLTGSGTVYSSISLRGNSQTLAALNPSWDETVSGGNVFIENRVFSDGAGGDGLLTIDGTTDSTWGSRVLVRDGQSGTLSLGKAGSGTLTLASANTYTGTTTINGGTVKAGNAAALGATSGGTTVSTGGTFDFNGVALAAEPFTLAGGTLTNTGAAQVNAAAGAVTVTADSLFGGTNRWDFRGSGASLTVNSGATLRKIDANTIASVGRPVTNDGAIEVDAGVFAFHTGGTYGGTGTYEVNTGGELQLGSYGSATTVTLPNAIVSNGGTLSVIEASGTGGAPVFSGSITLGAATTTTVRADGNVVISGSTGGSGGLQKTGDSRATLSGSNSYSGPTAVTAGILAAASVNALGSSSGVSVTSGATLLVDTATTGSGVTATINGSGASFYGALQGTASSTVSWAGDVVLGSDQARIGGGDGGTLAVDGVISDGGNGYSSIFSRAPNSTTVLNSVNTYTGDTLFFPNSSTVTLRMGVANAIDSASRVGFTVSVTGTANFDLNGFDQNVRALIDTQAATLVVTNGGSANAVLTLSESNAANTATFDGRIENGPTNTVALVKTGAGTQILSGTNTYTGTTNVGGGTLLVNGSLAATTVSVGSGATLGGSGAIGGPTSILAGGILSPGTSPGTIAVNNSLALDGGSILAFEIDAGDPTSSLLNDLITGVTDLTLGGTLNLSGTGDFTTVTQGTSWRLFNYTGSLTDNTLAIGTAPALAAGLSFVVDTSTANQVNLAVVPEPGSLAAVVAGLVAFAVACRRRRTADAA